jgi:hypothetical protein
MSISDILNFVFKGTRDRFQQNEYKIGQICRLQQSRDRLLRFSETSLIFVQKKLKFHAVNAKLKPIAYVYPAFLATLFYHMWSKITQ